MVPTFVKAMVPVPPTIELALPKVTRPEYVAATPLFISAPPEETPVPLMVKASAVAKVKPFKSKVASVATTVPAPVVPNGVLLPLPVAPKRRVPALIFVAPV